MTTIETIRDITLATKILKKTKAELEELERQKATIEFCENEVEKQIMASAISGIDCAWLPTLGRPPYSNDDEWYPLTPDIHPYANGKESLVPDCTKPAISIAYLTKYLQSRGFTVFKDNSYYRNYGYGEQTGHRIRVSW